MKQLRGPVFLVGFVAVLLHMPPNAFADEIVRFDVVTTYPPFDGFPGSTYGSGFIDIDTTTGVVDAMDLGFPGEFEGPWSPAGMYSDVFGTAPNTLTEIGEEWLSLDGYGESASNIVLPVGTLVGYEGGVICSTENPCFDGAASSFLFETNETYAYTNGQLVYTPEPSSLLLLVTGALFMGAALTRMKAKAV